MTADRVQSALSWIIALAASVMAVVLVHREFFTHAPASPQRADLGAPTFVREWEKIADDGILVGNVKAPVTIAEFSDLECPICGHFDRTLRNVRKRFPGQVSWVFVHFPLSQHRFARPAARAAECASRGQRFDEFVRVVYEKQDSLGLRPWSAYAVDAGLHDTAQFAHCVADTASIARIAAGLARGRSMGISGTPTIVVNGWRFGAPPSEEELTDVVGKLIAGVPPFAGVPEAGARVRD